MRSGRNDNRRRPFVISDFGLTATRIATSIIINKSRWNRWLGDPALNVQRIDQLRYCSYIVTNWRLIFPRVSCPMKSLMRCAIATVFQLLSVYLFFFSFALLFLFSVRQMFDAKHSCTMANRVYDRKKSKGIIGFLHTTPKRMRDQRDGTRMRGNEEYATECKKRQERVTCRYLLDSNV